MKEKEITKIRLFGMTIFVFVFGVFISFFKEYFSKFKIAIIIFLGLLVYKTFVFIKDEKRRELKKYLIFGIIGIVSFISGFLFGTKILSGVNISRYTSSMLIFPILYLFTMFFILFSFRNNLKIYRLNYFFGIISLLMGLITLFGFGRDYLNDNISFPYIIMGIVLVLGLFLLGFFAINTGVKLSKRIKKS